MLELMYKEMIARLEQLNASKDVINDYTGHWIEAMMSSGKPIPCPNCFGIGKKDSRLEPLPMKGSMSTVKCESCKEYFSYEEPTL